jgi:hypothetical protein
VGITASGDDVLDVGDEEARDRVEHALGLRALEVREHDDGEVVVGMNEERRTRTAERRDGAVRRPIDRRPAERNRSLGRRSWRSCHRSAARASRAW